MLYKHGYAANLKSTPEYNVWPQMRARCNNPKQCKYKYYGARGITVCKRWDDFPTFLADMGRRPPGRMTIERIDNNGNYEPSNCCWATYATQSRSQRRPKFRKRKHIGPPMRDGHFYAGRKKVPALVGAE